MITLFTSAAPDQKAVKAMDNKRVYTVDEIQAILGISKNTAYALVKSGAFHSVKIGGQYRISKKSFDEWLDDVGVETDVCQVCDG